MTCESGLIIFGSFVVLLEDEQKIGMGVGSVADTAYLLSPHIYYIINFIFNPICCLIYMQTFTKGGEEKRAQKPIKILI